MREIVDGLTSNFSANSACVNTPFRYQARIRLASDFDSTLRLSLTLRSRAFSASSFSICAWRSPTLVPVFSLSTVIVVLQKHLDVVERNVGDEVFVLVSNLDPVVSGSRRYVLRGPGGTVGEHCGELGCYLRHQNPYFLLSLRFSFSASLRASDSSSMSSWSARIFAAAVSPPACGEIPKASATLSNRWVSCR